MKHYTTKDKLIGLLKENPRLTRLDLSKELEVSINAIKQHILKLKKDGVLQRIGDIRNGHWEVTGDK